MATFKNNTGGLLSFPSLRLSIASGETYTTEDEEVANALRKSPSLEEVVKSSSPKRKKATVEPDEEIEDDEAKELDE